MFAELTRVAQPGAPLVVAFQSGSGERVRRSSAYGHDVPLTSYRHDPGVVEESMTTAGFELQSRLHRKASQAHETTPQAFLLALRR